MNRIVFTLHPHSVVDLITNSSSELFIGKHKSKETMIAMIEGVYPDFRNEYSEPKLTSELTNDEIATYVGYRYNAWSNRHQCFLKGVIKGFTEKEMYNGEYFNYDFITDETRTRVIEGIDPNGEMFFMFSHDDNPNWDYQEKLCDIMMRYHLG